MHDTAYQIGRLFFELYFAGQAPSVLDVGSRDFNGSLRACVPSGTKYVGVDLEPGAGVDVVLKDPYKLPFEPNSFDASVSSSCFEHDQMFWLTFLEMARVTKQGGFIYISAPSNGFYHEYPCDNWRFYPDAGLALTAWAKTAGLRLQLIESFVARRVADCWNDCVLVFGKGTKRTAVPPKLLCDLVPAPFNVRRYPKLDIENLRAETEDMILLQEAKSGSAAEDATAAQLAAERAEQRQLVEVLKLEVERIRAEADADVDRTRREAETSLDEQQRVRQNLEAQIGQLQDELATTRKDARQFSEALETQLRHARNDAAEKIAERDRRIDLLNANYTRVMNSDSWRVTLPLRKAGALLPPKARARLRWIPKSVYWLLTPHKIPARLRFIREREARKH